MHSRIHSVIHVRKRHRHKVVNRMNALSLQFPKVEQKWQNKKKEREGIPLYAAQRISHDILYTHIYNIYTYLHLITYFPLVELREKEICTLSFSLTVCPSITHKIDGTLWMCLYIRHISRVSIPIRHTFAAKQSTPFIIDTFPYKFDRCASLRFASALSADRIHFRVAFRSALLQTTSFSVSLSLFLSSWLSFLTAGGGCAWPQCGRISCCVISLLIKLSLSLPPFPPRPLSAQQSLLKHVAINFRLQTCG